MTPAPPVEVFTVPTGGRKITPHQWRKIEQHLDTWKAEVLAAARRHPAKSYRLGVAQVTAFADLLGNLNTTLPQLANFGGVAPTAQAALKWAQTYTLHELDDALNVYIGQIKDALLYGLRGSINPTQVASLLYKATKDATVNWRRIARTEMARANAEGRLDAIEAMGYDQVWCPPHMGSCRNCKRILENKVFRIEDVRGKSNFGNTNPKTWIACCPLHPHCRHGWLPYEPEVYEAMQAQYRALEDHGLDEAALDELFGSDGQLLPEHENDPRLQGWLETQKKYDVHVELLALAVERVMPVADDVVKTLGDATWTRKQLPVDQLVRGLHQRAVDPDNVLSMVKVIRRGDELPPIEVRTGPDGQLWVVNGQHRAWAHQLAGLDTIDAWVKPAQQRTDLSDEVREVMAKIHDPRDERLLATVASSDEQVVKDTFAEQLAWGAAEPVPEPYTDPHLFDGHRLRDDVAMAYEQWWTRVAGDDWRAWSRLFVTTDGTPYIAVDYDLLRGTRADSRPLADVDLHLAIVAATIAAAREREIVPGISLAPVVLHVHGLELDPAHTRGPAWDVEGQTWVAEYSPGGDPHDLSKTFPGYAWTPTPLDASGDVPTLEALPLALADRLVDGEDLGKAVHDVSDEPRDARGRWTDDSHSLHFNPGAKAARTQAWGRGLVTEKGKVVTWPEDDAITHAQMVNGLGEQHHKVGTFIIRHDGWTKFYGRHTRPEHVDRALEASDKLWTTEDSHRLVGKVDLQILEVAKVGEEAAPRAANTGVEHWITVHPHGNDDKGQPVLVRNNADGTMTVIGGAGGSLNYMRLDPKRRISTKDSKTRDKEANAKDAAGLGGPATTLTDEERQKQEQEFKANQAKARKTIERAEGKRDELEAKLREYVENTVGAKWLTHGLIRHADGREEEYELGFMERKQAMRKLVAGALQTLTVGEQEARDGEASPYLFTERHGDFEGADAAAEPKADEPELAQAENGELMEPESPGEDTSSLEDLQAEQERKINKRLPPLDEDQANEVMRLEREIARWNRIRSKARSILNAGKEASSAYALEWSDRDIADDVKKRVEAEQRTLAARELLETVDDNTYKASYTRALNQGAIDTVDSFTHAVIGRKALSPEAVKLLGPVASAQLIAHAIADKASQVGDPEKLSIDHVREALSQLASNIEADVSKRANARARVAMDVGVSMRDERKKSLKGESLWTATMTRSYEIRKLNEASTALGMAIGGFQASSALQVALEKPPPTIAIPGGRDAGALIDRAKQAGITLKSSQIEKADSGNVVAHVPFEDLKHLFDYDAPPDFEHRKQLEAIRTGKGLSKAVEANRSTPGMADTLAPEQAQGKMFLLASQKPNTKRQWNLTGTPIEKKSEDLRAQMALGDVLDFAPGVGKTHTGIAAAMQLMHDEPDMNHRVLVVAPRTALGPWLGTVVKQGTKTAQVLGLQHDVVDQSKGQVALRGGGGKAHKQAQKDNPCDFNVISHDQLKANPNIGAELGCTIVITDEAQKYKNEKNQRSSALIKAGEAIGVERPKMPSRTAWGERYNKLEAGHEHILREDKVREFRQSNLDDHLFHMDAAKPGAGRPEAGIGLPDRAQGNANLFSGEEDPRGYEHHEVTLDEDHKKDLQALVTHINDWAKDAKATGSAGPMMGGQPLIEKALLDRPGNAFARTAAETMAKSLEGDVHFGGYQDHPKHPDGFAKGDYAQKGMVFNQGVQELKHLIPELEAKGLKVFSTVRPHSDKDKRAKGLWESVDSIENDKVLADFLAHKGKGVLVTTDLNSTARSLQLGDNNGTFQHGATHMLHYSLPDNNATIQQREARIHRRGAVMPVKYHKLQAPEIPAQRRQNDRLTQELRTQQLTGNSEQLVGGKQTLRHRLEAKGVAPANEIAAAAGDTDEEGKDEKR